VKEVSCRALDIFIPPLRKKGIDLERVVAGTPVSVKRLLDRNERIDWSDFVKIMANLKPIFSEEELVEAGRSFFRSPMLRFGFVVGRLLFSPMEFYRWVFKPRDGVGNQMFNGVTPTCREISPTLLELDLTIPPEYEPCWDFFIVSKGNFVEMPRVLGYPEATVEMSRLENGCRYRIHVPVGTSFATRARRAVTLPFTMRLAARELKEAHEILQLRYEELEDARAILDRQARQLRTAHAVSELVNRNLDLGKMLEAITRALVEEAGFVRAEVELATEVDGVRVERTVGFGEAQAGDVLTHSLETRAGQRVGEIRVHAKSGADRPERAELLAFIAPTLGMALDNAISYEVLETYRKGLEIRVAERTNELSNARDEIAKTVVRLQEAKEARDRIFANVNHELRTPLSMILLAVAEARAAQGQANAPIASTLETIEHGARRLLRMVDELLLLAEGREHEIGLKLEPCDFSNLAAKAIDAWGPAVRAKGIELVSDIAPQCSVRGDRSALDRIVSNLLSNALKFTPSGGRIRVRVVASDGKCIVDVEDTGIGIDDDLRGRLFGRFERARGANVGGVGGSGLGLSLVKELLEGHGGTIAAFPMPERGTRFHITLPSADRDAHVNGTHAPKLGPSDFGQAPEPDEALQVYGPALPLATILVAEDDPTLRHSLGRLLGVDYRVYVARDGAEALQIAAEQQPDLLVTDVAMPNMDGIELTKRFLSLPNNRVSPVLVLTAFGEVRDRLAGFDAGAVDYIVKPFEPAELRARVQSQLALRGIALQLLETEKLAALGTLAAGLAHEMRNPANGIVNAVSPLRDVLPEETIAPETPAGELLDVIEKCSQQIAVLSRQLLGFQRGVSIDRKAIPLDVLLRRVRRTVQPLLEGREFRERFEYCGPVPCAEPLLSQVFANLLDNAAYAAGKGGWVEVRSALEENNVVVEVADSGGGVPANLRERIFEPFFTTKPAGSGTGLGLATAREIVTRHGGTLDVREGSGRTVFRVALPMETI
jgi:signal transduction histidine kinase